MRDIMPARLPTAHARAPWRRIACLPIALLLPAIAFADEPLQRVIDATEVAHQAGAHCDAPRPSPDGRWLAWVVDSHTRRDVFFEARDRSTPPRRITPRVPSGRGSGLTARVTGSVPWLCQELSWEPDSPVGGYVLACSVSRTSGFRLFHAPSIERQPSPITRDGEGALGPRPIQAGGRRVVFTSSRAGAGDLFTLPLTDTPRSDEHDLVHLTRTPEAEMSPAWSPDGARLVFASSPLEGSADLYLTDASPGAPLRRLTEHPGTEVEPVWSPDGARIAYFHQRAHELYDLHVVEVASGRSTLIAADVIKADRQPPAWTPDGRGLVYAARREPINPLTLAWLDDRPSIELTTDTLLNQAPGVVALPDGRWWLVWIAQARLDDTEKRWNRVFTATLDPRTLTP